MSAASAELPIQSPEAHPLGEFDPLLHPVLALQTYEFFGGDPRRATSKAEFAEIGNNKHLWMDYPRLREADTAAMRAELEQLREAAINKFGANSMTVSSIEYRIEETDFLASAARLQELANDPKTTQETLQSEAERFVALNDRLYGVPDQAIVDGILAQFKRTYGDSDGITAMLWQQIEAVLGPISLEQGTTLPELSEQAAQMLKKELLLAFPAVTEARGVMADVIAARTGLSSDYIREAIVFNGADTAAMFRLAASGLAAQHNTTPYGVELDPNGDGASWESGRRSVVVGAHRTPEKGTYKSTRATGIHESTHGQKFANGVLAGEPAMATGVYVVDESGKNKDYLSFEEAHISVGTKVLNGTKGSDSLGTYYYLAAGLAYRGLDDIQIRDVLADLFTIQKLHKQPEMPLFDAEKTGHVSAVKYVERIFRGAPTHIQVRVNGHPPAFTKDLAYTGGELIAVPFWNQVAEAALQSDNPQAYFHRVFAFTMQGKIDPTDPRQFAAAEAAYDQMLQQ